MLMDMEKVGNTIAFLRKRVGYTQKDLADRIGISDKAVSKWERGLSLPDITYLRKLSILLNTDSDSLLAGAPVFYTNRWRGIIVLKENIYGIGGQTIIYDKPLVYFILSYFLLVGITNILIVCNEKEKEQIWPIIKDGTDYGLELSYHTGELYEITDSGLDENVMLVYGRCFLYGVDQTRFFQKAMADREHLTVLALPKKANHNSARISIDADKRIINVNTNEPLRTQYDYCTLPILFFPSRMLNFIIKDGDISGFLTAYAEREDLYVELMDRGFVEIEIDSWVNVQEASTFIKIIQDKCGMNVYCIEEVAWRRGLISFSQLERLSHRHTGTEYGDYLLDICNKFRKDETV